MTPDAELYQKLRRLRFFGHDDSKDIVDDGCNGKMTEIHAALGLANLVYQDDVLKKRKTIFDRYHENLKPLDYLSFQEFDETAYNYGYMPVVLDSEERLLKTLARLNEHKIYPRRYFYPSLNTMKAVMPYTPMPISEFLAQRIICLPSYNTLALETVDLISDLIKTT